MAAKSGKKFGGVKQKRRENIPAVSGDATPTRKIGGVKSVSHDTVPDAGNVESCPDNCPGEYIGRTWIHSRECCWASVLWDSHGKTESDWHCPYDCDPIRLSSGWTHPHICPFWDFTGRTPFDHNPPRGVRKT